MNANSFSDQSNNSFHFIKHNYANRIRIKLIKLTQIDNSFKKNKEKFSKSSSLFKSSQIKIEIINEEYNETSYFKLGDRKVLKSSSNKHKKSSSVAKSSFSKSFFSNSNSNDSLNEIDDILNKPISSYNELYEKRKKQKIKYATPFIYKNTLLTNKSSSALSLKTCESYNYLILLSKQLVKEKRKPTEYFVNFEEIRNKNLSVTSLNNGILKKNDSYFVKPTGLRRLSSSSDKLNLKFNKESKVKSHKSIQFKFK